MLSKSYLGNSKNVHSPNIKLSLLFCNLLVYCQILLYVCTVYSLDLVLGMLGMPVFYYHPKPLP